MFGIRQLWQGELPGQEVADVFERDAPCRADALRNLLQGVVAGLATQQGNTALAGDVEYAHEWRLGCQRDGEVYQEGSLEHLRGTAHDGRLALNQHSLYEPLRPVVGAGERLGIDWSPGKRRAWRLRACRLVLPQLTQKPFA